MIKPKIYEYFLSTGIFTYIHKKQKQIFYHQVTMKVH